jgi:hypothetical protein
LNSAQPYGVAGARWLRTEIGHRAPIPVSVHRFDAETVTGTHADPGIAVLVSQGAEHLHELSIELDGNEPVSARIEARRGARFIGNAALECDRRLRFEATEESPERRDHETLEDNPTDDGDAEHQPADANEAADQEPCRAEANEEAEENPGREKRTHAMAEALVYGASARGMTVVVYAMAVRRAMMRVAGVPTMMVVSMPRSVTTMGMVAESC